MELINLFHRKTRVSEATEHALISAARNKLKNVICSAPLKDMILSYVILARF